MLKYLYSLHQQKSLISVEFRGLICRKIKNACFPTPVTAPNSRTFCCQFFNSKIVLKQTVHNSRKLQVRYLALVGNDSSSSLRRPSYSHFFRASSANPLFPYLCPIGILGNPSITAKWRSAHIYFIVFFISVEPHKSSGKIRRLFSFLVVINCPNYLRVMLESINRTAREISSLVVCHRSLHKTLASQSS